MSQKETITKRLHELGVMPGQTLLVHSSLKSFGWVEGGADTIIDALIDAVCPNGNVMVPTLTGSAELSPDNPPVFNVFNSPCWTGRIPEIFRKRQEARRSLHPTHSVSCIGPDSEWLLKDHHLSPTPCGKDTPYHRLAQKDGLILLFGANFESVTLFHTVEELAGVSYHMQPEPVRAKIIDYRGKTLHRSLYIHKYGDERCFSRMEPVIENSGGLRKGKILKSTTRVIRAKILLDKTLEKLNTDPNFLLDKEDLI